MPAGARGTGIPVPSGTGKELTHGDPGDAGKV